MTGWPVAWKCFVACLFLEESQQPTWPHVRQSRRCTHSSPLARHSSQPSELGVTGRICLTCAQLCRAIGGSPLTESFSHLLQILVNKLNGHGALADRRGDALDRAGAHVPRGEHASVAGLQ